MTEAEARAVARQKHLDTVARNWKLLAVKARAAGMHELADHAQKHADMHDPPEGAKIGDAIAKLTKALGIEPCDDCKKRQAAMNTIDLGKPVVEVAKGVVRAIFHPDDVLRSLP